MNGSQEQPSATMEGMTLGLVLLWTLLISLVAVGGAYYARRTGRYDALLALFVTLVIAANIMATKTVTFDFGFVTLFAPGGVLVFAVTFLLTDVVNERFGRGETKRMIFLAFLAQAAFLAFSYLAVSAVPAPFYMDQEAFATVLASVPRIALAGLAAFLVSELLDAYLFQWFRTLTRGKHLWVRNAFSTLPALLVDSTVFVVLAFYGVMPLLPLIVGLTAVKWLVGIVDIPFMYLSRYVLGEGRRIGR